MPAFFKAMLVSFLCIAVFLMDIVSYDVAAAIVGYSFVDFIVSYLCVLCAVNRWGPNKLWEFLPFTSRWRLEFSKKKLADDDHEL